MSIPAGLKTLFLRQINFSISLISLFPEEHFDLVFGESAFPASGKRKVPGFAFFVIDVP
jgi:hypothetical protein